MAGKQKEKSAATKKRIIECAERLFYEKGFNKTSVREIVKAAGVAQGTFYLYFETKEEIVFIIVKKTLETFNSYIAMLDVENPKLEDINTLIDAFALFMVQNPKCIKLIHNANIMEITNLDQYDSQYEWFTISVLKKWLENASKKDIICKVSPQLYSRIILLLAHELLENSFLYEYPDKISVVKEELKLIIRKILI